MSSVRRIKERGGGGGTKITAAAAISSSSAAAVGKHPKSITPQSEKSTFRNGIGGGGEGPKKPAGKENIRATSRGRAAVTTVPSQKPVMKAMPRIDKASASAANGGCNVNGFGSRADSRARWSTSSSLASAQRGRSPSPSEFSRGSSNPRASRVSSLDQKRGSTKVSGKCEIGKLVKNSSKSGEVCVRKEGALVSDSTKLMLGDSLEKLSLKGKLEIGALLGDGIVLGGKDSNLMEKSDSSLGDFKEGDFSGLRKDIKMENKLAYAGIGRERDASECGVKESLTACKLNGSSGMLKEKDGDYSLKVTKLVNKSEVLKDKCGNEDGKGSLRSNVKYPSKLHEKLAFLEGKVKRIASDIKRTKDMLDMNNPDSSKVILSDIQEKISGIEKAMGHVGNYGDAKNGLTLNGENDGGTHKQLANRQESSVAGLNGSVKGLKADELEARLFPHHKLLRDRTSLKSSSGSFHSHETEVAEANGESKLEEESDVPVDENPIALEFLASLSKEQSRDITRSAAIVSEICEVQEMDDTVNSASSQSVSNSLNGKGIDHALMADERLEEFDNQENQSEMVIEEESEDGCLYHLTEIGRKTTTGGWFVSEGESVLLAHDDGSCSFYDITNSEEKALYNPPNGMSPNMWRDCWIIRAPSADGCSGRYVVAASAGNSMVSGFCSWDFYTKDIRAFHTENNVPSTRTALAPLPNTIYRRNVSAASMMPENQQWWYRPCGPLIVSAASCQREIKVYDIRDGEHIMTWELQKPVLGMDHSSPLQWRNRGKVVLAESEAISLWDVSSLNPQALLSIPSSTRRIVALHVNNTDAELGGGVRQRVSSSETEGHDGVFCTSDSINVLDFRHPSGIGIKMPKVGLDVQSVFSRGDSVFLGGTNLKSAAKNQYCSQIQQFSLRKQRLHGTYMLPESNAHSHFSAITQVWGNSGLVMGVNGMGLFVFDAVKEDGLQSSTMDCHNMQSVREVIGPDDLYSPSFDYLSSRVLLVSRDRPALWRYLS